MKYIVLITSLLFFSTVIIIVPGCTTNEQEEKSESLLTAKADSLPDLVDYNIHVRPILSDKCFNCHGPDKNKREGGLRLDTKEAYESIEGRRAIVPHDLGSSEAILRIFTEDAEIKMPLPASNLSLTDLEKAILVKWVKQGANYKPHWAFLKPEKHPIPVVKKKSWVKNGVDNFILAKIESAGMTPSDEASKVKLARRVSFDLTGLPPTPLELDFFLQDNSANAYEKYVDKLLASPHYGERLATEWMDVARYADSHGYQDDGESEMWPWRDWVIKAFNKNLPYDKFITWQLAGDLLPKASKEQVLATAFNRNHMINAEGGIVDEEFRTEYVLDRVGTTGKAFLGLTVECARCHDHKYDPISQKEFYSLSSFFNQLEEPGKGNLYENSTGPTMLLTDEKIDEQLKFIREKIKAKDDNLSKILKDKILSPNSYVKKIASGNEADLMLMKSLVAEFNFDEDNLKDSIIHNSQDKKVNGKLSKQLSLKPGLKGNALAIIGEERTDFKEPIYNFERYEPFSISMWIKVPKNSVKGYTLLCNAATTYHGFRGYELLLINGKVHVRINSAWPSNALQVISKDSVAAGKWTQVAFSYDGSSKAEGINIFIDGKLKENIITHNYLYRTIKTHTLDDDQRVYKELDKLEKKRPLTATEARLKKQLYYKSYYSKTHLLTLGGRRDQGVQPFYDGLIDEVKIFNRNLREVEMASVYTGNPIAEVLKVQKFTAAGIAGLYLDAFDEQWKSDIENIKALRMQENDIILPLKEIKVMKDKFKVRESFILDRGSYDAPTVKVGWKAIDAVLPFSNTLPKNRLGLAKWLTNHENPLVARVTVNRYWQMIFGNGLVSSSSDFGNQGSMPSHPELLDWLSINFVTSGWDVKNLLRLIVTSATYKQSSLITKDKLSQDPQNILLARAPKYRLPYEMIRDNALAASGLLNNSMGGPSFKPYQPIGLWEEKTESPVNNFYVEDKAPEIYRRSMYILIKRTSPPPSFSAFDGAERFVCQVKRQNTNTPIQALTALNDPQFFEASRVIAESLLKKYKDDKEQLRMAFRNLTSRYPIDSELDLLLKMYRSQKDKMAKDLARAKKLVNVGQYSLDKSVNVSDLAALTMVTHTILNLDEAVSKE